MSNVMLKSLDGDSVSVSKKGALLSVTIKDLLEGKRRRIPLFLSCKEKAKKKRIWKRIWKKKKKTIEND